MIAVLCIMQARLIGQSRRRNTNIAGYVSVHILVFMLLFTPEHRTFTSGNFLSMENMYFAVVFRVLCLQNKQHMSVARACM
jgi:hypothetical protein